MGSTQPDYFHHSWKQQKLVMVARHDNENRGYKRERDEKENHAKQHADRQLEQLRNTVTKAQFDAEAAKMHKSRDETLVTIRQDYDERIRRIKEIQRKEMMDYEKAYHEAIAARSFGNAAAGLSSSSAHPSSNIADSGGMQEVHPLSSRAGVTLAKNVAPPVSPSQQQKLPARREVSVSTFEPSKPAPKPLHIDTSVNSLPTPTSTVSATDDCQCPRTVTFEAVYQQGQAEHKDTIVEFPPESGQWYILKCEEHEVRFNQRPLKGAAKHLNGRDHGHHNRSYDLAIKELGYRVIGCDKQKAELNNRLVESAFASGYRPMNPKRYGGAKRDRRQSSKTQPSETEIASSTKQKVRNSTPRGTTRQDLSLSPSKYPKTYLKVPDKLTTDPKAFHIYYAYWKSERRIWPVMILGWDDQTKGGLQDNLASTGLLKKEASPPKCYIYGSSAVGDSRRSAIVGWAPGYEDGGPKVNERKFPVMFFDDTQSVSWLSASCFSKFPLYDPDPPTREDHPFNAARRWIAKKEGFNSWEEFEKAQKTRRAGKTNSPAVGGCVLPASSDNCSSTESGAEDSDSAVASDTTERELLRIQETAGEIPNDEDYEEPDTESSEEDEHNDLGLQEDVTSGWPLPLYSLRSTENILSDKQKQPSAVHSTGSPSSGADRSAMGGLESACELAAHEVSQNSPSAMSGDEIRESVEGRSVRDGNDDNVRSTVRDSTIFAKTTTSTPQRRQSSEHVSTSTSQSCAKTNAPVAHALADSQAELLAPPCQSRDGLKGTKRVRTEGETEVEKNVLREESLKRAKLDVRPRARESNGHHGEMEVKSSDTSGNYLVDTVAANDAEQQNSISSPPELGAAISFTPKLPLGTAAFELSSYSKGASTWSHDDQGTCLQLYYEESNGKLGTVNTPISIIIDPTAFVSFTQDEIPNSKGNSVLTLSSKNDSEAPMRLVFGRNKGSKVDIGKIQVRSFMRWLRLINPRIRKIEG